VGEVERDYAEHFLGEVAEAGLSDERRPRALTRLDGMRDDLRRAWAWAVERRRHDLLEAALRNWAIWHAAGTRHRELVASLSQAIPDGPPLRRARFRVAEAAWRRDERGRADVEACLAVFEREEAWLETAQALENLAVRAVSRGDFDEAARLTDRGLEAAERAGARGLRVSLLNIRASPAIAARDHDKAEDLYRTAMKGDEDDPLAADRARGNLADLCVALGRPREAIALTRASLELDRARNDFEYALRRRHVLARAMRAAGDDVEAEALLRRQLRDLSNADLDPALARHLRWLAARHLVRLLGSSGRTDEAERLWRDTSPSSDARAWRGASWLATGGWLALQAGDVARADGRLSEALDEFDALPVTPGMDERAARTEALLDGTASALAAGRLEVARKRCARALDGALDTARPPLLLAALLAAARLELHAGRRRRACLLLARVLADPRCHAETRGVAKALADRAAFGVTDVLPLSDGRLGRLVASLARAMR
jgi:tetratricopeptide (TPR) repeat protein